MSVILCGGCSQRLSETTENISGRLNVAREPCKHTAAATTRTLSLKGEYSFVRYRFRYVECGKEVNISMLA